MLFLREHPGAVTFSIAMHAAIGAALVLGLDFFASPQTMLTPTVIHATVVDQSAIDREMQRIAEARRQETLQRERAEREQREAADAARREREREQEQLRVQREKTAAEQRERDAAAERERQRVAELERQRQEEERRQAEAERQRRAEEERRQAEAREQQRLEDELAAALEAEQAEMAQRERDNERYGTQYADAVMNKIRQHWNRPLSARPGLRCIIYITQIPSGDVVDVELGECNGDALVQGSIIDAALAASPLPKPPVPSLYERIVEVLFEPEL